MSAHRDKPNADLLRADCPRTLVAGHSWKPKVAKYDIGLMGMYLFNRCAAVVSDVCRMTEYLHQLRKRVRCVTVVLHDHDMEAPGYRLRRGGRLVVYDFFGRQQQ